MIDAPKYFFDSDREVAAVFQKALANAPSIDTLEIRGTSDKLAKLVSAYKRQREKVVAVMSSRLGEVALGDDLIRSWQPFFEEVLSIAHDILGKTFDVGAFSRLVYYKHRRYSAAPLLEFYELGLLIRLGSKIARLTNMVGPAESNDPELGQSKEESIEDTLVDIIGYCVLGIRLIEILPHQERKL